LQAYDAGRYEEAIEKLAKAYQVVHVPTLAVHEARAMAKLGRLVAASELYLEASRIPRESSWQKTQDDAIRDAVQERNALLARIPRLTVIVRGARAEEVALTIDGVNVPSVLIGNEQLVDPGERKVEGHRGAEVVAQSIPVNEGEQAQVTLEFAAAGAATPATAPHQPNANASAMVGTPATTDVTHDSSSRGSGQRLVGWVGIGTGVAGLLVGGVTGAMAYSKRSSLRDSNECSSDVTHCDPSQRGNVDTFNSLRNVSTVGFIAGGVLAAAGVTVLLTAPRSDSKAKIGLWISPQAVALHGGF
jgi:hypothetical protein